MGDSPPIEPMRPGQEQTYSGPFLWENRQSQRLKLRYSTMRAKIIAFSLLTVLGNGVFDNDVSANEVFRCVGANGDVSFTNMACPTSSRAQVVATYVPVPDSPAPTYDSDAAANAAEARRAAQQARAAAEQAQALYAEAHAGQAGEQSAEPEYATGWTPYYAPVGFYDNHRHRRDMVGKPMPPSHRPVPTPHRQGTTFAPRR
jgi:hypothetical protein